MYFCFVAIKAFSAIGNHLQKRRQNDLWDTYGIATNGVEDPAEKDEELLTKLRMNSLTARHKEQEVY